MRWSIAALMLMLPLLAWAQSRLPACPATGVKHDCFGTHTYPTGWRYVGEFRHDRRHGLGIHYDSSQTAIFAGRWSSDAHIETLALDTTRFPFNPSSQVAAAPAADPGKAERERLAAEAEAERRKRQQLEAQLEAEKKRRIEAESRGKGQPTSSGTGFSVAPGLLVTNQHVVAQCQRLEIVSPDGRRAARVIDADELVDLALVRVTGLGGAVAPVRRVGTVRLGEPAFAFGFPLTGLLSEGGNFTDGVVSSLRGMRDSASQIQISTPVQPGNSGGALADASGSVIGVVVGKLNASAVARATGDIPQNVNFAVSLQALSDFLRKNNVSVRSVERGAALDTAQLAEVMRSFTHRVECLDPPAATAQSPPRGTVTGQTAGNTTVILWNRSQETIFRIYVSPRNSDKWGSELLGARILSVGGSFTLEPPATQGCIFDVRVEYKGGRHEQKERQDFCALSELVFSGEPRQTTASAGPNWVLVSEPTTGSKLYVDPSTIRRDGNLRRYWEYVDYASRTSTGELSARSFEETDCREERRRMIETTGFSEAMLQGRILVSERGDGSWRQIAPGTVAEGVMRYVCAR